MKTILSYGMGIESSSLLVYWCENRSRMDFDLTEDLIAITAMTGDEHIDTKIQVERAILPRMRQHDMKAIASTKPGHMTLPYATAGIRWRKNSIGIGMTASVTSKRLPEKLFGDQHVYSIYKKSSVSCVYPHSISRRAISSRRCGHRLAMGQFWSFSN